MDKIYLNDNNEKKKSFKLKIFMLSILIGILSKNTDTFANQLNNSEIEYFIDTESVKSFEYFLKSGDNSFYWINNYPDIEELTINIETTNQKELEKLEKISNLKNLKKLKIFTKMNVSITNDNFAFLKNCKNLRELIIDGPSIEKGVIESLKQIKKLSINCFHKIFNNIDTDFNQLIFLDELNFLDSESYDIPIWFNSNNYKVLKRNGVNITSNKQNVINNVKIVNSELDYIIKTLNISKDESEIDKFDKILIYVLSNLEYDEYISQLMEAKAEETKKEARRFYENGFLYGALEMDSAICGNYAALLTALCRRVGVNSYCLCNSNHAWNMVEIDDNNYFTDPTLLDDEYISVTIKGLFIDKNEEISMLEAIEEGFKDNLDMYLSCPYEEVYLKESDTYNASNFPSYIEIQPVSLPTTGLINNNYKFEIRFNDFKIIIVGATLVSVLITLNVILSRRKKEREKIMEEFMQEINMNNENKEKSKQYIKNKR